MTILLYFAAAACAACALWTQEENRKLKKLATKMQNMAVKEQEKWEKAETETQWWRERVEIVKAERDRLRHFETECLAKSRALEEREKELAGERDKCRELKRFETECLAKSRALEEREKELAGERDKCAELRRLLAETREMLDEERRLRADDEKEIRNIMNYDGTADSQEALDEK